MVDMPLKGFFLHCMCVTGVLYTMCAQCLSPYSLSSAPFVRDGIVSSDFLTLTRAREREKDQTWLHEYRRFTYQFLPQNFLSSLCQYLQVWSGFLIDIYWQLIYDWPVWPRLILVSFRNLCVFQAMVPNEDLLAYKGNGYIFFSQCQCFNCKEEMFLGNTLAQTCHFCLFLTNIPTRWVYFIKAQI